MAASVQFPFDFKVWQNLPRPTHQQKLLEPKLEKTIRDIRAIVLEHKMEKVVGIALLHRHFEMNEDEVLVESFIDNRSITSARSLASLDETVVPHMWMVKRNKEGDCFLYPLEFVVTAGLTPDCRKLNAILFSRTEFLKELIGYLVDNNLEGILGPSLVHRESIRQQQKHVLNEVTVVNNGISRSIITDNGVVEDFSRHITTFYHWAHMNEEAKRDGCAPICDDCKTHCNDEDVH